MLNSPVMILTRLKNTGRKQLFLCAVMVASMHGFSQVSPDGQEFILNLTWKVPFRAKNIAAYNYLVALRENIYDIQPTSGDLALVANFKSNPHINLSEKQKASTYSLGLSIIFDKSKRIKARRIFLANEVDMANFNKITTIFDSFSNKKTKRELNDRIQYLYYNTSTSKSPFAIITYRKPISEYQKESYVIIEIFDSLVLVN